MTKTSTGSTKLCSLAQDKKIPAADIKYCISEFINNASRTSFLYYYYFLLCLVNSATALPGAALCTLLSQRCHLENKLLFLLCVFYKAACSPSLSQSISFLLLQDPESCL